MLECSVRTQNTTPCWSTFTIFLALEAQNLLIFHFWGTMPLLNDFNVTFFKRNARCAVRFFSRVKKPWFIYVSWFLMTEQFVQLVIHSFLRKSFILTEFNGVRRKFRNNFGIFSFTKITTSAGVTCISSPYIPPPQPTILEEMLTGRKCCQEANVGWGRECKAPI